MNKIDNPEFVRGWAGRLALTVLLLCSFSMHGLAQDSRVSLSMRNASLKEVLKKIESSTSYRFFYSDDLAYLNTSTNANFSDTPVKDVLSNILDGSSLTWKTMENNAIVIVPKGSENQKTVRGVVKDDNGNPFPGVAVIVKGTSSGTSTNSRGEYMIELSSAQTLVFQFLGYLPLERSVMPGTVVNVQMQDDVMQLEQVVMIGYGSVAKKDLTGSVSSIGGDALMNTPVATAAEAIAGRMAGVQIVTTEGNPDADILIRVRGGGSITQDNSPLYVVDGFPSDDGLTGINPNDIESIDVLKDASSTAIYGSRGANGVIMITTRKGVEGRPRVTYNGYVGIKKISKFLDVLDAYDYVITQHEIALINGVSDYERFVKRFGTFDQLEVYRDRKGVNWQKEVFGRTAIQQSHDFSVSGGVKGTKYMVKYSNYAEEGVMVNSDTKRNYLKISLDQQVTSKLKMSANANYTERSTNGGFISGSASKSSLGNTLTYRPVNGIGGNDEDLFDQSEDDWTSNMTNPLTKAKNQQKKKTYRNVFFNGSLAYDLTRDITLNANASLTTGNNATYDFTGTEIYDTKAMGGPYGGINTGQTKKITENFYATYKKKFKKIHSFDAMVGQEIIINRSREFEAEGFGMPDFNLGLDKLDMATLGGIPYTNVERDNMASFFGRVNYNYDSKYYFTGSFRADGSSKFGPKNHWGYFPSMAVAWRMSEENFVKQLNTFSNLKLRFSYGAVGNNRIKNNLYATTFSSTYYAAGGGSISNALMPSGIANPDLKWESTITRDLGLDIGLFKGRMEIVMDLYKNTTTDLLLNSRIPSTTGYTTQMKNVGNTQNKGIELAVNSINISRKNFTWTTNFNIAFNKGKITALNSDELGEEESFLEASGWGSRLSDFIVKVGHPVGTIFGYISDGFYTADDFEYYDHAENKWVLKNSVPRIKGDTNISPGDLKLKSINGTYEEQTDENGNTVSVPVITDEDRTILGNTNPKFIGGITNTFTFRNFDLSAFLSFSYGNKVLNANMITYTNTYNPYKNFLGVMKDRYRLVNDAGELVTDKDELNALNANAKIYRATSGNQPRFVYSDAVEDGSYLRLQSVTIGYTLPAKICSKLRLQQLRVYASGQNLHTWTKYSGYDPEVNAYKNNPLTPGVDYSAYPKSRSFVFGLNLSF